ncbi:MAG: hypothetical protein JJT94_05130 [Bernardetiaceae bacterium]|nr:hypothetical protein [Bernardetiaceae bacterium]
MNRFSCFISLFALLCCLSFVSLQAQSADEIIQKTLDARGGEQAFQALKTLKMEAEIETAQMPGHTIPAVIVKTKNNKMRSESTIQGMSVVQAYDGQVAWMKNPMSGQVEKIPDGQAQQIKEQAYFDDLLIGYKSRGMSVEAGEQTKIEGKGYYQLIFTEENGTKTSYYIDFETHLPYLKTTIFSTGGQEVEVKTYFENFQEVGKVKMPFIVDTQAQGQSMSKVTYKSIEPNVEVDESIFDYPN